MKLSAGEIDAIVAGCEGVTPGPWSNSRNASDIGNIVDFGVPPKAPFMCLYGVSHSDGSKVELEANAAHIARLDPATVLSLASEVKALREALTEIAKQQIRDEVAEHGPLTKHDFAGGYDVLVQLARNALAKTETHSGTDK